MAAIAWLALASAAGAAGVQCVADDVNGMVRTARVVEPDAGWRDASGEQELRVGSGSRMSGTRWVWTVAGARARLVFPGWSLLLGPDTRVQLGAASAPVVLAQGSIRVDNRPGDPEGPAVVAATRLIEVHTPGDGRALISVIKGSGKVPDTMRVIALRGNITLAPFHGTVARQLAEGCEVTGAGWIPVSRWTVRQLTAVQRTDLERRSLMSSERAQLPGKSPLIPHQGLSMDGNRLLREDTMYLSRGDVPEGRISVTGTVRLERVPRPLGEVYVAASTDGGASWQRLKWTDDHGGFQFVFVPQDGTDYRLQFGVFQVRGGKLYETTVVYPVIFREAFLPAFSDLKVCGAPVPAEGASLTIYSDELHEYAVVVAGTVRCDAPLSRVRVEVSPDAGVRWRPALITGSPGGEPAAGTFRVAFTPVPGAGYRFRLRSVYEHAEEKIRPHQVLSEWDAPTAVRYLDMRSVDRLAALVRELEAALRAGDQNRARALFSPHFDLGSRDLSRGLSLKLRAGATAREAGTLQIAVDWERADTGGEVYTGHAIFLYVKQADYVLVDILGDDPFSLQRAVLKPAEGEAGPAAETITLALGSAFDFEARRTAPYSESAIPDDLGFYRDDTGLAVLGTHDRRLAALPDASLAAFTGVADLSQLEYRAQVVPQEGGVLYLKTRQGGEVVLEVQDAGSPDARTPRVKLAYRMLSR